MKTKKWRYWVSIGTNAECDFMFDTKLKLWYAGGKWHKNVDPLQEFEIAFSYAPMVGGEK